MEIIGFNHEKNSKSFFMEDFFKLYLILELYFHAGRGKFVTKHKPSKKLWPKFSELLNTVTNILHILLLE